MKTSTNSISLRNLQLAQRICVDRLTLTGPNFVHLLGENGAGKTTLLAALAGLETHNNMQLQVRHRDISAWAYSELAQFRCFLTQQHQCQFDISVAELFGFFAGNQAIPAQLDKALQLSPLLPKSLLQLSGGELQRVHIGRNLLQVWSAANAGNAIILFDEPLQNLDIAFQQSLLILLGQLVRDAGNLVVMSSHDFNSSFHTAQHVLLLKQGTILAEGAPRDVITEENLKTALNCDFRLSYSENAYEFFIPKVNSD